MQENRNNFIAKGLSIDLGKNNHDIDAIIKTKGLNETLYNKYDKTALLKQAEKAKIVGFASSSCQWPV